MDSEKNDKFTQSVGFDEALAKTGLGKFHVLLLVTCGLCLMATIVETLNIGFVIPLIEMECELTLSQSNKGLLNGAAFAGVVVSSFFWGFLADWESGGRKRVMHFCTTVAFAFSLASSFSINVAMLIVTKFFVGFFISGIAANTYAFLGEFHTDKRRAKYLQQAGIFMAFALTFSPGLGFIIMESQSVANMSFSIPVIGMKYSVWRIFLLVCSMLTGIVSILLCFLPESPKFLLAQGRHDEAVEVLRSIHRMNFGRGKFYQVDNVHLNETLLVKDEQKVSMGRQIWQQTSPLFKSPYLKSTLKTIFCMFSLFAGSSGFFMWTPDVLNKLLDFKDGGYTVCDVVDKVIMSRRNATIQSDSSECNAINVDSNIFAILFLMGLFFSSIYFINGMIIYRVGKRNLLAGWFVVCGIAGIFIPWSGNYHVILVLMLIFLTCGCCGSILSAVLVDIYPTSIRAMALCVVLMMGRLGAVVGSNFVSFTIESHCELMFGVFGGILLMSAAVSLVLPESSINSL